MITIVAGTLLRIDTGSAMCPDWPTCFGAWAYPETQLGQVHYWHRLISAISFITVLIAAIITFVKQNIQKDSKKYAISMTLIMLAQMAIGYFVREPIPWIRSVHFFISLISIMIATSWLVNYINAHNQPVRINSFQKLARGLTLLSLLMVITGILVSLKGSSEFCSTFPLCSLQDYLNPQVLIVNAHRLISALVFGLSLIILHKSWLNFRSNTNILVSTTITVVMLIGQVLIGAIQVVRGLPLELVGIHAVTAITYFIGLVYVQGSAKFASKSLLPEKQTIFNDAKRRKDFYLLNKPIIVLLLLVITYAGMVVGGGEIPSFKLTFWTLSAGALAAGGSSALNQFMDRKVDLSMQRTANRPIPSGRLSPSEGLALGIAEVILSFFLYATFVNILSAILAMAGMIYYVFIYSFWLKHATVQNIVIGGGAGAIPPLVGWAATTGSLNVPSLFLFALVFLWTPPHFWALAIVRKNDYARANIPMLPVIKGEKYTRLRILIYTIELVVLTLIMPLFGVGGSVYLISASLLGIWILYSAWRVFTVEGNKVAHKMYRYSSMYLAFIFLALVIDVLV
jgi:protoheme IX farnesyltransferase